MGERHKEQIALRITLNAQPYKALFLLPEEWHTNNDEANQLAWIRWMDKRHLLQAKALASTLGMMSTCTVMSCAWRTAEGNI
jgi:hypothetical protein